MATLKKVQEARSKKNGIIFYSNIQPLIGVETYFDENKNIKSRIVLSRLDEVIDYLGFINDKNIFFDKRILIIFDMLLILLSILICKKTGNYGLVTGTIYFAGFVSFDLFNFIKVSYSTKYNKENNGSTAKFHGAEHMVLNAYQSLQKVPTLEEVKQFSHFSKNCGSRFIISRIFLFSIFSFSFSFLSVYYVIFHCLIILLAIIFSKYEKKYGWLSFLQIFITSKPTDNELHLAIEGLKQFELMENSLENGDEILAKIEIPYEILEEDN